MINVSQSFLRCNNHRLAIKYDWIERCSNRDADIRIILSFLVALWQSRIAEDHNVDRRLFRSHIFEGIKYASHWITSHHRHTLRDTCIQLCTAVAWQKSLWLWSFPFSDARVQLVFSVHWTTIKLQVKVFFLHVVHFFMHVATFESFSVMSHYWWPSFAGVTDDSVVMYMSRMSSPNFTRKQVLFCRIGRDLH